MLFVISLFRSVPPEDLCLLQATRLHSGHALSMKGKDQGLTSG